MACQRIIVTSILGKASKCIAEMLADKGPEAVFNRMRSGLPDPPIVYFCEYIDPWSMPSPLWKSIFQNEEARQPSSEAMFFSDEEGVFECLFLHGTSFEAASTCVSRRKATVRNGDNWTNKFIAEIEMAIALTIGDQESCLLIGFHRLGRSIGAKDVARESQIADRSWNLSD